MRIASFRSSVLSTVILFALAACSGGSGSNVVPAQGTANSPRAPGTSQTSPASHIYVGDIANNTVRAFDITANGDVPPLFTITGPVGCNFTNAGAGVAVDSSDRLYVGDAYGFIDMYQLTSGVAPNFIGDFAAARPYQIATGSTDNLYVADQDGSIWEYARDSSGSLTRVATIAGPATQLGVVTYGVAVDSAGEIFALVSAPSGASTILVFPPHSNGNVAPMRVIAGPHTLLINALEIAVDSAGAVYAANFVSPSSGVTVYAPGANGDAAPIANITGPNTTLDNPSSVAVDATGKIYVTTSSQLPGAHHEIAVFAPGANGNVAPIAVIAGPNTGLLGPSSITVH